MDVGCGRAIASERGIVTTDTIVCVHVGSCGDWAAVMRF